MAFDARWNSSGIGYNGAGLLIFGDTEEYIISWGSGPEETVTLNTDTDGDGEPDAVDVFHIFPSDGTYDITVTQSPNPGEEPMRLKAYMYTSETSDLVIGTAGLRDMVLTGSGDDTISTRNEDDWVDAGDGADTVDGGGGNDFLIGSGGDDRLNGGTGVDLVAGGDGADNVFGGSDIDFVYGDAGTDKLHGDAGDDYLDGGADVDRLIGGAGFDTFAFGPLRLPDGTYVLQDDPARDTIVDFEQGSDLINLVSWGPMTFIGNAAFSGDGPEARTVIRGGNTLIFGDYDGDGAADFSIRLNGEFTLTQSDVTTAPVDLPI